MQEIGWHLVQWWPVGLILFGGYLFVKARMDRPRNPEAADPA